MTSPLSPIELAQSYSISENMQQNYITKCKTANKLLLLIHQHFYD